jgi:hypothetical protein
MYFKLGYCKTVVLKYFSIVMSFWKLWYLNTGLPNRPQTRELCLREIRDATNKWKKLQRCDMVLWNVC